MFDILLSKKYCEVLTSWILTSGVKVVSILIASLIAQKLGERLLRRLLEKTFELRNRVAKTNEKRKETLYGVLSSIFTTLVWGFAFLTILPEFGINIQALLAGGALVAFAIGRASKKAIEDYVSGIFILFSGQYKVGDKVSVGGEEGTVTDINLRRTILKNGEGKTYFIPHHKIDIITRIPE